MPSYCLVQLSYCLAQLSYSLVQLFYSLIQLSTTLSSYLAALCSYSTAVSNPPCVTDSLLPPLHSWSCAGRHSCPVAKSTTWMFRPGGTSSFYILDWNSWTHFFNSESLKRDTFEVFPLSFAIISISISGMAATCIIDFNAFWQQANDFIQHIYSPVKKKRKGFRSYSHLHFFVMQARRVKVCCWLICCLK